MLRKLSKAIKPEIAYRLWLQIICQIKTTRTFANEFANEIDFLNWFSYQFLYKSGIKIVYFENITIQQD